MHAHLCKLCGKHLARKSNMRVEGFGLQGHEWVWLSLSHLSVFHPDCERQPVLEGLLKIPEFNRWGSRWSVNNTQTLWIAGALSKAAHCSYLRIGEMKQEHGHNEMKAEVCLGVPGKAWAGKEQRGWPQLASCAQSQFYFKLRNAETPKPRQG